MGFFSLLMVASSPVIQLLLIGSLGAFLASGYSNILSSGIRRDLNKIVFVVFSPSLIFSSLAETVTLQDLVSWWFMPVNIAITFLIGGTLGWVAVKILRPPHHLEGLVIANCSAGNLGNIMLMIIPAVCGQAGNPFGDESTCSQRGMSYVSLSMALGGFFIWTHTYSLMKKDCDRYEKLKREGLPTIADGSLITRENDSESGEASSDKEAQLSPSTKLVDEYTDEIVLEPLLSSGKMSSTVPFWKKTMGTVHQLIKELMEPPTIAAMIGFVVGAIPWIKSLIIGESAPLRVIQDSIKMLGKLVLPKQHRMKLVSLSKSWFLPLEHRSHSISVVQTTERRRGWSPQQQQHRSIIESSQAMSQPSVPLPCSSCKGSPSRALKPHLRDGTLPCTTLILGGNLTNGLRKSTVKPSVILAIALVRYIALPISGIAVVKAAAAIGLLPQDPLFHYVLLTQFTLPPAVAIGVMAQLFGVGQEESSVIFLWLYLVAALALTVWSTVFMYIISF